MAKIVPPAGLNVTQARTLADSGLDPSSAAYKSMFSNLVKRNKQKEAKRKESYENYKKTIKPRQERNRTEFSVSHSEFEGIVNVTGIGRTKVTSMSAKSWLQLAERMPEIVEFINNSNEDQE